MIKGRPVSPSCILHGGCRWLSQQASVPAQVQLNCPERWMETGTLNSTLPCSWSVGLYSHNWAQATVFRWQPPPTHTWTPWRLFEEKKSLRHIHSMLESWPWEATLWDHRTRTCTCPTSGRPVYEVTCPQLGTPTAQKPWRSLEVGCQHIRARTAFLLFPRNWQYQSWKPLSYFGNRSFNSNW